MEHVLPHALLTTTLMERPASPVLQDRPGMEAPVWPQLSPQIQPTQQTQPILQFPLDPLSPALLAPTGMVNSLDAYLVCQDVQAVLTATLAAVVLLVITLSKEILFAPRFVEMVRSLCWPVTMETMLTETDAVVPVWWSPAMFALADLLLLETTVLKVFLLLWLSWVVVRVTSGVKSSST